VLKGWGRITTDTEGFYPALKLPESVPVLEQRIREVEKAIPSEVVLDMTDTVNALDRDETWCAPGEDGYFGCFHASKGSIVCPTNFNVVQCLFLDAHLQIETKDQIRELRRAITDALELPTEELRKRRYANYYMEPDKWTFEEILYAYFGGWALVRGVGHLSSPNVGFYPALEQPESVLLLKRRLKEVEAALPSGLGD
jgi:hypothetical protein